MPQLHKKQKKLLKNIARQYLRLYNQSHIGTHDLTPTNYVAEKDKFFLSDTYNPQFTYRRITLPPLEKHLSQLRTDVHLLKLPQELASYVLSMIDSIEHGILAKKHIGTHDFSHYIKSVYPIMLRKSELLELERSIQTFTPVKKSPLLNAEGMQRYFEQYIKSQTHVRPIHILVDHFNDHMIRVSSKRLIIGAAVIRREANVKRLIVHEIESHMLQRQNLRKQKNPLLRLRSHHNRELYAEGMAVYNEITTGTITKKTFQTYYLRARAVEMLQRPFREIYTYLARHMDPEKAYMTAYRVKRGMPDTAKPGGYPKDALYILGYQTVRDYIARGGRKSFLYLTQDPELGELLLKYDLLPVNGFYVPHVSR